MTAASFCLVLFSPPWIFAGLCVPFWGTEHQRRITRRDDRAGRTERRIRAVTRDGTGAPHWPTSNVNGLVFV